MASNKIHQKSAKSWQIERLDPASVNIFSKKLLLEHLERYKLASSLSKGKTVIELGCGTGYGSNLIASNGAKKVFALDIDTLSINKARKKYKRANISYLKRLAENTKLQSNCAELIVCFELIQHVQKPEKVIKEIKRLLKPDGILLISTPNKNTSLGDNPFHLKEFTISELDLLLSGFKNRKYFGQGKAFLPLTRIYQKLIIKLKSPLIRFVLHLKPWEGYKIYPLKTKLQNTSIYNIAVCKK